MCSEIKDVKQIETKLEELEITILRKRYRHENTNRRTNRVKKQQQNKQKKKAKQNNTKY